MLSLPLTYCDIGLGWGNALQEVLLDSYLAYKAGRSYVLPYVALPISNRLIASLSSYVFDNYTWSRDLDPPAYSEYNGKLIPSRIPLRTMIVGMSPMTISISLYPDRLGFLNPLL